MNTIWTLTMNPAIDLSVKTEGVEAEKKLSCRDVRRDPGGGGLNVARALAHMGRRATAMYCAGGAIGDLLDSLLQREGLDQRRIRLEAATRENITVTDKRDNAQYRFGMPGAKVSEREWREVLDTLVNLSPSPRYLVASGSLPPGAPRDFYSRVARVCRENGIQLFLDTKGEALVRAADEEMTCIKPNIRELRELLGRDGSTPVDDLLRGAAQQMKAHMILVSMGAQGAVLLADGSRVRVPAPRVEMGSRIGAGDSMMAGFVEGLLRGLSLGDAARHGVAAGTAAVITPGTELCRGEDVQRLYEQVSATEERQ